MNTKRIAVAVLAVSLGGCSSILQRSTDDAQARAQAVFVGQRADAFFAIQGLPYRNMNTADGAIYEWQSPAPGPFCRARLTADSAGVITSIRITMDVLGMWGPSRCAEVLR